MLKYINQYIGLFVSAIKQAGRGKIWLLLIILTLINWLLLFSFNDFLSPLFYGAVMFWTGLVGKANAAMFTHYPTHYLLMPYYFGLAKLIPGLILETLFLGAIAVYFRNSYLGAAREGGIRVAASRWLQLILVWVVLTGLTVVASIFFPEWFAFFHQYSPRRLLLFNFVIMPFFMALVLSLFYFAIPAVVVYRENFLKAIGRSLRLFARRPLTAFFLSAVILAGPYLFSALAGYADQIVLKFKPELVYWVLLAGLVVEILANYFWMGTAVRFLMEEEPEV
jgi:hypothetical protein